MHKPTTNKSKYFAEMKRRCINRSKENKVYVYIWEQGELCFVHPWLAGVGSCVTLYHSTLFSLDSPSIRHAETRLSTYHLSIHTLTVLLLFTPIHSRFCGFFAAIHPPNKWASLNDNLKNFNLLIFCMKAAFCYHPPWGRKFWGKF